MPGPRGRAREDTWGRLLAPARPALTPTPALRTSHFPDPPPATLRQLLHPSSRLLPPLPAPPGPQPPSSGLCVTAGRTSAHSPDGNNHPLTQRGARSVRRLARVLKCGWLRLGLRAGGHDENLRAQLTGSICSPAYS